MTMQGSALNMSSKTAVTKTATSDNKATAPYITYTGNLHIDKPAALQGKTTAFSGEQNKKPKAV